VTPPAPVAPPDQPDRDRVRHDLSTTLFVEAGAGSGKTTALVDRVLSLVTSGTVELREIAAITFTEKAAAELRDRVRQQLEKTADQLRVAGDRTGTARCELAIDQLDGAAIGTLHAFAQRILSENPIEAGLPPRVEILDEVTSEVEFEQRWVTFRDEMFADPAMERTLLLLFATGVQANALRALAVEFDRNWDLVEERVPAAPVEPPLLSASVGQALDEIEAVCRQVSSCTDTSDKLYERMVKIAAYAEQLRGTEDELDLLDQLSEGERPSFKVGNIGSKLKWSIDVPELKAAVRAAGDGLDDVISRVTQACARRIGTALRQFTLDAAEVRQAAGQLAFHDLLVLSRALVRHPEHGAAVRQRLHDRYRRLLLDEFQDTDPIQIELAVRIAAADPTSPSSGTLPWDQVPVTDGQLFVVGDPKQSIYRFRRADISVFLAARDHFGAGDGLLSLSTNFRTGDPIIEWVNHAFARLMAEGAETDVPVASQATYVPLTAVRPAPKVGPAVSVLAREPMDAKAGAAAMRANEAAEVASAITRMIAEGWSVGTKDETDPWRSAKLGDITVLVPARTSLPFLEDALDDAGIAYRAESSSLVYVSRAVRDLLITLRAIDDPTDHLSIVAALRTPLFACGDDDLFHYKVTQRGHWNFLASPPDTVTAGPVLAGLTYLRERHAERHWLTPAELLDRIARDRRLFELGFAEGRTRDVWRRLRFVTDQARAWSEATNGGLREYLQWVGRQTNEGARVAEAVLPETDDDAVRIMTIHAAKGLEFPITILSGMSTLPQARPSPAQVAFPPGTATEPGGVGYRFGKHVTTEEFEAWKPIDEQMGFDERVRLLYVAATRAKDHLVLSVQRRVRASEPEPNKRTNAELLVDGSGDLLAGLRDAVADAVAPRLEPTAAAPPPPAPFDVWQQDLTEALRRGSRPTTVAATALTDEGRPDQQVEEPDTDEEPTDEEPTEAGLRKRQPDQDLPPWLKGRYGTAVGRAVHATLQTVDLATGDGLASAVRAQCEAEAIPDRAADVTALAQAALATSTVVEAAASGAYWREVYACVPSKGRLLEGYIDLLYRTPDGMVVADYKTAATNDPEELARRVEGYRLQGASYALTVAQSTGEVVTRVVFVFLTPKGAVEITLDDLDRSVAEVQALIEAGQEHVLT